MRVATVEAVKLLKPNLQSDNFIYNAEFIYSSYHLNSHLHAEKENYDFV